METPINIEVLLSEDDIKNYWRFLYSRGYRKYLIFTGLFFMVSSFILVVFSRFMHGSDFQHSLLHTLISPYGIFVVTWITLGSFLLFMPMAKGYLESNKFLQQSKNFIFSEERIKIRTETSNSDIPWDYIHSIEENKNYFFIFIDKLQAFIIPKNCFQSTTEVEALKILLKNNIEPKKLKLLK